MKKKQVRKTLLFVDVERKEYNGENIRKALL